MKCPNCNSEHYVKNGKVLNRQRYKCKDCGLNYSVERRSMDKDSTLKRFALSMYLEGLGFRSISRLLKVSHVSVINWIKLYGQSIKTIRNDNPVEIAEMDEIHTYVGRKKTIDGFGLLLIEREKSLLISLLATEEIKPVRKFGTK
jgi:transposase-like protein